MCILFSKGIEIFLKRILPFLITTLMFCIPYCIIVCHLTIVTQFRDKILLRKCYFRKMDCFYQTDSVYLVQVTMQNQVFAPFCFYCAEIITITSNDTLQIGSFT